MIHLFIRWAARRTAFVAPLLWAVSLLGALSFAFAATVGDQVELKAAHPSGIPLHQEPRGTNDFQRIPDGTQARVIDVAKEGKWLKLSLLEGRTGWVTARYVSSSEASAPSPGTSPTAPRPQRIEEGMVTRVADGDTLTVAALAKITFTSARS